MWNWKKLQTAVLLLAVTMGSGLLIGSYTGTQRLTPSSTASVITDTVTDTVTDTIVENELQILRGDDDPQPDQIAKIVIDAQEIAEIGELVRFDLSESVAQAFKWLMVPETIDFETYYDGQCAVFSARKPGSYMFIVGCAYNSTVDVATHIVMIEGTIDPVGPVGPVDSYPNVTKPVIGGLDQWAPYWCSINKRPKDETEKLAGSFESIVAQIAAGVLQKTDDIVEATADANRKALGKSLSDWLPVLQELQAAMKMLAGQGKLSTPDQHQVLWTEIAEGLHYYVSLFN